MTLAAVARTLEDAAVKMTRGQLTLATAALRLSALDSPQCAEVARAVGWEVACAAQCTSSLAHRLGRFRSELETQIDVLQTELARCSRQLEKDERLALEPGVPGVENALLVEARSTIQDALVTLRAARAGLEGL